MNLILLTVMSLLITALSDIIVLILNYLGLTYNLEYDMSVLKYLPFDTNSPESMT